MVTSLNAPYGGKLVQRLADRDSVPKGDWPRLRVNSIVESDLINIAVGAFSPLEGFMGEKDFLSVCRETRLSGSGLPWTIPILFDLTDEEKARVGGASRVLLESAATGELIGFIEPSEIYSHDRKLRIDSTFGVDDEKHPGVKLTRAMGPWLIAGPVTAFRDALSTDPLAYPTGVRARLAEMGMRQVAGFQTRNVVHRAHEYLQRVALEVCDGLLVHPVVGWKKAGDFKPEAVRAGYRRFIDSYFPKNKALLAFLNVAMRYAGPREAVMHAIIRKNYGCSHFIVGRDHAGVGGFYDTYAAHQIFDRLPALGIEILRLREPFYCAKCESIATDRTCGHGDAEREYISGTKIRKILSEGVDPQNHIFRTEVLESLRSLNIGGLFFE